MRLGTIIAIAALGMAMTLGGGADPACAGDKGSKKRVHINSNVSTKNLVLLEKKLKGSNKQAVQAEIHRRGKLNRDKTYKEQAIRSLGRSLATGSDGEDPIIGLWALGVELGTRRKGGH